MSHLITQTMNILDLSALSDAVSAHGAEFVANQSQFLWFNGRSRCSHAIRLPGGPAGVYEIGVVPSKTGIGYELQYDTYGSGRWIADKFGADLSGLKEEYGASVAARALARKGYAVTKQRNPLGELQLVAVKR